MSGAISIAVGSINHSLLAELKDHVEALQGVDDVKLVGGQLEVVAAPGVTEEDVKASLREAGLHWVWSSVGSS